MERRATVITGVGPITGFGTGIDPLWTALLEGRSAIRRLESFDVSCFPSKLGAELAKDDFDVRKIVPKSYRKAAKVMCRDIELAVGAAAAAVEDAGLTTKATNPDGEPTIDPGRVGCHIGAGLISADVEELSAALMNSRTDDGSFDIRNWGAGGMQHLTPLWLLKYLPNMLACHVTIVHDCHGPSNTITCCESSSALSLAESIRVIQRDAADACLTGGAESRINPMGFLRQHYANRLAETNGDESASVVRPFDHAARGTILGEGGGILIVEAGDVAKARGATPYAEVVGIAATQSFCPDTVGLSIDEPGEAIADAITVALRNAGISPEDIDAIVPFGSSIPAIDRAEAAAIRSVFGERAGKTPLITTIPNVGNCCAGNGAISLAIAAKCLREQKLPARMNSEDVDGLDARACDAREATLDHILVISTAQGGQNSAVVFKRASSD